MRDYLVEVRPWIDELVSTAATLDDHAKTEIFWSAAVTACLLGDDTAALAAGARLEPLLGAIDDPYLEAVSHMALAWILPIADDLDGALREASLCREHLRDQDEPFWTAVATDTLGELEMSIGRLDDALRHLTEVRQLSEQFDNMWLGFSWSQLGTLAIMQGRLDDAGTLLDEGLTESLDAENTVGVTMSLAAHARLALVQGTPDRAAVIFGAAEGLRRRVGLRVWPTLRRGEAELAEQLEHALSADRYQKEFATGSALSRREAAAMVRGKGDDEDGKPGPM
jgi:tetratricopeptide (TPR) repeat protein